jgi:hypothetical protein
MALVDMKMSKAEAKEQTEPTSSDLPQYPWGLNLHLDDDELEKLGVKDLKVGSDVVITAKCSVTSSSSHKSMLGDSSSSVDLQITEMEIGEVPTNKTSTLYDKTRS